MLVGPRTETGDERKASAALLPDVNGNFRTSADFGALKHVSAAQTLVGGPKSRAQAGRFGMLWLTALTFSVMKKAQAADPNVTFLDDDNITYKDLEHGAFELVTKEAVPRRIIVEDPGETIVLSKTGSSVSVSPSANTRARMEELQEAQQDVLANLAKGPADRVERTSLHQSTAGATNQFHSDRRLHNAKFSPPAGVDQRRGSRDHFRQGAA